MDRRKAEQTEQTERVEQAKQAADHPERTADYPKRETAHPERETARLPSDAGTLRRWEIALALSLVLTLLRGAAAPCAAWWGVIFPGLTAGSGMEAVEAVKLTGVRGLEALRLTGGGGTIEIRFFLLEWLARLLG